MRKIILYIAQSLDGYIAKSDGDINWLETIPNPEQSDYGYKKFINSIDTVIMGRNTFEQVCSFDMPYPYQSKENFVFTKKTGLTASDKAIFIFENHLDFVKQLKAKPGEDIWLIGGGKTNTFFLKHDLIDQIRIFIMPIVLGNGIPLFDKNTSIRNLKLEHSQIYNSGVTELWYKVL